MDIITDLSSEAVSYLTVIQDICRIGMPDNLKHEQKGVKLWEIYRDLKDGKKILLTEKISFRIKEIVWLGSSVNDIKIKEEFFLTTVDKLLLWLEINSKGKLNENDLYLWAAPNYWRVLIKDILYSNPTTRLGLVEVLHYMPLQIIFALTEKQPKDIYDQRLYQFYIFNHKDEDANLINHLSKLDIKKVRNFWNHSYVRPKLKNSKAVDTAPESLKTSASQKENVLEGVLDSGFLPTNLDEADILLKNDSILLITLNSRKITVPFVSLFEEELREIKNLRKNRAKELNFDDISNFPWTIPNFKVFDNSYREINYDPEKKADAMELAGLAFSGGGIRSATFNLGILQKLAELGTLPRFDYISTVSGGGYIGAWYTSWIYRNGSIKKVIGRLNSKKAPDPFAEEVRPIRWLRMYSNYLSPKTSIMSADSWTVGITWLRNTIINQLILLSILLTVLSTIDTFYRGWDIMVKYKFGFAVDVLLVSSIIILIGSFFAGSGMKTYNWKYPPAHIFSLGKYKKTLSFLIIGWCVAASILVAFLFLSTEGVYSYSDKYRLLSPGFWPCLIGMLSIALIGGYHRKDKGEALEDQYSVRLIVAIISSSIIASLAGVALLSFAWMLIQLLSDKILVFVFGIPIILESLCFTIVTRMIIMGKFFSDERREWWGRLGALVHRFMFWWILITMAAIWFPANFRTIYNESLVALYGIAGGWAGIIGVAVKMAYSSNEPEGKSGGKQIVKDIFIKIAPYLFMIGFLLIGAAILDAVVINESFISKVILMLALATVTILLSWRAGVNEFSLHDFYKNRLVRAYLGATRRRIDREKTANSFTGFDKEDDLPLGMMKAANGYCGPYPLINTALNATTVSELDRQDRMAESFVFSPLYCGFDFNRTRSSSSTKTNVFNFGYRPTEYYSKKSGPLLGTAIAISGAAVSPNMGYHSSSAISFLLTVFNVRLGRWIGNPRKNTWQKSDPGMGLGYLLSDLIGKSDVDANYVYLSDGGHFDNMGLYELIRRRCFYIVLGDGEQDSDAICEGLANSIRRCRIDFGVEIELDVTNVTEKNINTNLNSSHFIKGIIKYPNSDRFGTIIYIKTSMTNKKHADIREYFLRNSNFPQQSTGDQFFDEAQFESYRKLGYDSIESKNDLIR